MTPLPFSIYAELLSNIRQISLAISLHRSADPGTTKICISHDDSLGTPTSSVLLVHRGLTGHLLLPGQVACPDGWDLPVQRRSDDDGRLLTWRLPLLVSDGDRRTGGVTGGGTGTVPWEAKDLKAGGPVVCRKCRTTLVEERKVIEWKALPAEGWAEMMEFWHCHKPGEEGHHGHGQGNNSHGEDGVKGEGNGVKGEGKADEETLVNRGYGAASAISAQKGVGFVDLTTVLFDEGDVTGVLFSSSSPSAGSTSLSSILSTTTTNLNIFCSTCHTRLGYFSHHTNAATLFKWQLVLPTVRSGNLSSSPLPSIPHFLSSTLQATLSRTASSKSILLPIRGLPSPSSSSSSSSDPPPPPPIIHFWILNPSLKYTSTQVDKGLQSVKAMKVLYRILQSREEVDRMLDDVNGDVQEVNLPEEAVGEVLERLRESNGLLPEGQRRLREWEVGMLGVWEG